MLINELEELEDILDTIVAEDEEDSRLLESDDEVECVETCMQLMSDYIDENPTAISEPYFHEEMIENIKELFLIEFGYFFFDAQRENFEEELEETIEVAGKLFYSQIIPQRSYDSTFIKTTPNLEKIEKQITKLKNKPQPTQRTKEWYEHRHNLITASNAYKAFENESSRNQLIYEKCVPLKQIIENEANAVPKLSSPVNVNTAMHWGQKYEPVSVMIYEDKYKTTVGDFGCIQHETYRFLGASPDGINIDQISPRYGRMLEIKNPVNREIDGVPKKEYWIQMQLQMETCDLDECDFLETQFVEYVNEDAFKNDGEFSETENGDMKGVIMYFSSKEGVPIYKYKPLSILCCEDFESWEQQQMAEQEVAQNTWIKNIFWKLEECSCVLVLRNKKWFQDNIGAMEELWKIVEKERVHGYSHRAPIKRVKPQVVPTENIVGTQNGCLININKINGKTNVAQETIAGSPPQIIRIRTESIDETKQSIQENI
jgi:putative phage-type endonuclease